MKDLDKLIQHRFSFLIQDYNFQEPKTGNLAYENYVEFKKRTISVIISYEDLIWISFYLVIFKNEKRDRSKAGWFDLKKLIPEDEYQTKLTSIPDVDLPDEVKPKKNILHNYDFHLKKLAKADREIRVIVNFIKENDNMLKGDISNLDTNKNIFQTFLNVFKP